MKTVKPAESTTDLIKVAITDDHVLYRAGVKTALGMKKDIQVIFEADNGMHLLNMLKSIQPDVILLDVQMPIMDGYRATAEIRKMGIKTPVVALTAHALKEERERALQSGFTDYLSKPVNRKALIEHVAYYGGNKDSRSPDAKVNP